jgi:Raf kinase inhibitor-like YbhB/YbcL family protein
MVLEVSSPAFEPGGPIPAKHAGEGQDVSPPLEWSELPEGTKEVALICDDSDAPTHRPFVHWVAYKIPADRMGLPQQEPASRIRQRRPRPALCARPWWRSRGVEGQRDAPGAHAGYAL